MKNSIFQTENFCPFVPKAWRVFASQTGQNFRLAGKMVILMQNKNGIHIHVSYNKLWKLMIDKNIKKGRLQAAIHVSKGTMAKMGKNENVSLSVLLAICEYLNCDFGDIVEAVATNNSEVCHDRA